MEFHRGRLFDHVHLYVSELEASKRFYRAVLQALGRDLTGEGPGFFFADELFVSQVEPGDSISFLHFAFQADSKEVVEVFYDRALASGGKDNGAPGERRYHPGYYAAYVTDPDGNNVECVFHGKAHRSAASVLITPV